MGESPVDKARAFDGIVGPPFEAGAAPPSMRPFDPQVFVSVSGDVVYAPWATGLEDDLNLLAQAFAEGGVSLCREMVKGVTKRSSSKSGSADRYEEMDVTLMGLELDSADEEELRDLIRLLVEKRIARDGSLP